MGRKHKLLVIIQLCFIGIIALAGCKSKAKLPKGASGSYDCIQADGDTIYYLHNNTIFSYSKEDKETKLSKKEAYNLTLWDGALYYTEGKNLEYLNPDNGELKTVYKLKKGEKDIEDLKLVDNSLWLRIETGTDTYKCIEIDEDWEIADSFIYNQNEPGTEYDKWDDIYWNDSFVGPGDIEYRYSYQGSVYPLSVFSREQIKINAVADYEIYTDGLIGAVGDSWFFTASQEDKNCLAMVKEDGSSELIAGYNDIWAICDSKSVIFLGCKGETAEPKVYAYIPETNEVRELADYANLTESDNLNQANNSEPHLLILGDYLYAFESYGTNDFVRFKITYDENNYPEKLEFTDCIYENNL